MVPDDQVGVTIVHPRLHHPLPPLDVAAAPHQRCHGPLPRRAIVQLATRPHRLPTWWTSSETCSVGNNSTCANWGRCFHYRGRSNWPNEGGSIGDERGVPTDTWRGVLWACVWRRRGVARPPRLHRPGGEVERAGTLRLHCDPSVQGGDPIRDRVQLWVGTMDLLARSTKFCGIAVVVAHIQEISIQPIHRVATVSHRLQQVIYFVVITSRVKYLWEGEASWESFAGPPACRHGKCCSGGDLTVPRFSQPGDLVWK